MKLETLPTTQVSSLTLDGVESSELIYLIVKSHDEPGKGA